MHGLRVRGRRRRSEVEEEEMEEEERKREERWWRRRRQKKNIKMEGVKADGEYTHTRRGEVETDLFCCYNDHLQYNIQLLHTCICCSLCIFIHMNCCIATGF